MMTTILAVRRLAALNIRPRVSRETELIFRAKPCRRAKEILNRCGFTQYQEEPVPPTPEQLEALFNKLGPQS